MDSCYEQNIKYRFLRTFGAAEVQKDVLIEWAK